MKTYITIILLATMRISAFSQITDTCEYVSQNYELGGFDCAWGIWSNEFQIDSYQWVNCDDMYSHFIGDTSSFYQSNYSGNVAVITEALGCVDTSYCHDACIWGIEESSHSKKEIVTILDLTGRETKDESNAFLIYVYNDGTMEKVFRVDE